MGATHIGDAAPSRLHTSERDGFGFLEANRPWCWREEEGWRPETIGQALSSPRVEWLVAPLWMAHGVSRWPMR